MVEDPDKAGSERAGNLERLIQRLRAPDPLPAYRRARLYVRLRECLADAGQPHTLERLALLTGRSLTAVHRLIAVGERIGHLMTTAGLPGRLLHGARAHALLRIAVERSVPRRLDLFARMIRRCNEQAGRLIPEEELQAAGMRAWRASHPSPIDAALEVDRQRADLVTRDDPNPPRRIAEQRLRARLPVTSEGRVRQSLWLIDRLRGVLPEHSMEQLRHLRLHDLRRAARAGTDRERSRVLAEAIRAREPEHLPDGPAGASIAQLIRTISDPRSAPFAVCIACQALRDALQAAGLCHTFSALSQRTRLSVPVLRRRVRLARALSRAPEQIASEDLARLRYSDLDRASVEATLPQRIAALQVSIGERKAAEGPHEDYFDRIDTAEKAYLLGLLYGDGSIHQRGTIRYRIALRDRAHAEWLAGRFGVRVREVGRDLASHPRMAEVTIRSRRLWQALVDKGFQPNKARADTAAVLRHVPAEYMGDFVRGLSDADGHVANARHGSIYVLVGSRAMMGCLAEIIAHGAGVRRPRVRRVRPGTVAHEIRWDGARQVRRIGEWLYQHEGISLSRKAAVFRSVQPRLPYTGVRRCSQGYEATIRVGEQQHVVGTYPSVEAAARAHDRAAARAGLTTRNYPAPLGQDVVNSIVPRWPRRALPSAELDAIRDRLLQPQPRRGGLLLGRYDLQVVHALVRMTGDHQRNLRTLWAAIVTELASENRVAERNDYHLDPADVVERWISGLIDLATQNAEITSAEEREVFRAATWGLVLRPRSQ